MSTMDSPALVALLLERLQGFDPQAHLERLGCIFRSQRKRLGCSQEVIAAVLGIARSVRSKLERAEACPHISILLKLCHLYQISSWVLLPSPPGSADAVLLPIIAQLSEQEKWAAVTVFGRNPSPASCCCTDR